MRRSICADLNTVCISLTPRVSVGHFRRQASDKRNGKRSRSSKSRESGPHARLIAACKTAEEQQQGKGDVRKCVISTRYLCCSTDHGVPSVLRAIYLLAQHHLGIFMHKFEPFPLPKDVNGKGLLASPQRPCLRTQTASLDVFHSSLFDGSQPAVLVTHHKVDGIVPRTRRAMSSRKTRTSWNNADGLKLPPSGNGMNLDCKGYNRMVSRTSFILIAHEVGRPNFQHDTTLERTLPGAS